VHGIDFFFVVCLSHGALKWSKFVKPLTGADAVKCTQSALCSVGVASTSD
jgi:hypothetical protein